MKTRLDWMKSRKEPNLIRPPVPVSAAAGYGSPDAESIGTRQSDEFYADLDARLTSLLPRLQQAISLDDCHWVEGIYSSRRIWARGGGACSGPCLAG